MRRNPPNRRENKFFKTSRDELVALSRSGDEEAAAELIHRGRDPQTGLKTRGLGARIGKAVKNPRSRPKGRASGFFMEHPGGGYSGIRGAKSTDGRRERVRRRRAGREEIAAEMMEMRGESYRRKPSAGRRHGSRGTAHSRDELVALYFQAYDRSPEDQAILREMGFPYPEEVEANKGIRKGHIQALLTDMEEVQLPSDFYSARNNPDGSMEPSSDWMQGFADALQGAPRRKNTKTYLDGYAAGFRQLSNTPIYL